MRVVFATAELSPVATVGGLAAAAAGLGAELRCNGVDVDLVIPDYGDVTLAEQTTTRLDVPGWVGAATVRTGRHPVVGRLHLVSVPGIARPHPYLQPAGEGWSDNAERFFRFARAVAAFVEQDPPDVLHLNDWHTGPVLAALSDAPPTVLTLHNLAYQGNADASWRSLIGPRAAHYEWWGGTNPLSGAVALADRVVAVSPHFATEIVTPEGGFGLDEPLRHRGDDLIGILNGIDTDVWDPANDPLIAAPFTATSLEARDANRAALHERIGFPDDGVVLGTVVTRLTHQKGIDLLVPLVPLLAQIPMRLAILGSGDASLAAQLRELGRAPPRHAGVRRELRRGAVAPAVRRGRPVPDAEPVRAVRAHPDAGDALRRGPRGDRRRWARRHRHRRRPEPPGHRLRRGPGLTRGPARDVVPGRATPARSAAPTRDPEAHHGHRLVVA